MSAVIKVLLQVILLLGCIVHIKSASLRCYKGSLDTYLETPLTEPLALKACIDRSLPTVIYAFGYRGRISGPATTTMISTYLAKKKRNIILLNWEEEASSGALGITFGYVLSAVPNAKTIGAKLGNSVVKLAEAGVNASDIHLVGHSLGAHLMGYAGRVAREKGHVISRITGLDPAKALFEGAFSAGAGLDRTCARFVDIIHSDPGGYGTNRPGGTIDIWPNYEGSGTKQPGCPHGNFEMFIPEDLCSHDRSWRYFSESLLAPTAFIAVSANNYHSWLAGEYRVDDLVYMGDLTSVRARGSYFLTTEPKSPFGKGTDGIKPVINETRRRRASVIRKILGYIR